MLNNPLEVEMTEGQLKDTQMRNRAFFNKFRWARVNDFTNATWKDFQVENEQQENMVKIAKKFEKDFLEGKPVHGLFLGKYGNGKTLLANILMNDLLTKPVPKLKILYFNMEIVKEAMKDAITYPKWKERVDNLRWKLRSADLVVVDDLGKEGYKDYLTDFVELIMTYRENRPLLITSNLVKNAKEEGVPELDFSYHYDESVLSRLRKNSLGYSFFTNVKDYRK